MILKNFHYRASSEDAINVNLIIKVGAHTASVEHLFWQWFGAQPLVRGRGSSPPWIWKHFVFSKCKWGTNLSLYCYTVSCSNILFERILLHFCLVRSDLHITQLMPLPLTISCSSKSRLVLPSWFYLSDQFTRVVPDKIQKRCKTIVKRL